MAPAARRRGQPFPADVLPGLSSPPPSAGAVLLCLNPRGCRPLQAQQVCSRSQNKGPPSSVWPCFLGHENSCPIGQVGDILYVGTWKLLPRFVFYPTPEPKSLPKSVTLGCLRELGVSKPTLRHSFCRATSGLYCIVAVNLLTSALTTYASTCLCVDKVNSL